jgi:hypothetical protein
MQSRTISTPGVLIRAFWRIELIRQPYTFIDLPYLQEEFRFCHRAKATRRGKSETTRKKSDSREKITRQEQTGSEALKNYSIKLH